MDVRRAAPKIQRKGFHAIETTTHTATVRHLFFQKEISWLQAFDASVTAQASGARGVTDVAGAGHYGRWTGNLARDVRRVSLKDVGQAQRVLGSHSAQGLDYWNGQDSNVVPLPLGTRKCSQVSWRRTRGTSSFAAIPQQIWGVKLKFCAKHGIKDDLTLGLGLHGDGVAHQKRKTLEYFSWNVLCSDSAERCSFGLVEQTAW